jgi:carbamoylphosphate synthase large subunit
MRRKNPKACDLSVRRPDALNIATELEKAGVNILGTSPDTIDLAEDRDRFPAHHAQSWASPTESGMASNWIRPGKWPHASVIR